MTCTFSDGIVIARLILLLQMVACALIAAPFCFMSGPSVLVHLRSETLTLVLVGCLMAGQNICRVRGLQLASVPSVATLLYLEILFCVLLDVVAVGTRPRPLQYAGAILIISGAIINAICVQSSSASELEPNNSRR